jgi:uncharacterized DUF497 family protein
MVRVLTIIQPETTERFALSRATYCHFRYPVPCARAVRMGQWQSHGNLRKHSMDFADAIASLEDPNRVEETDDRFVYDEERVQVIGMAHCKVLFVVVTLPGEDIYTQNHICPEGHAT